MELCWDAEANDQATALLEECGWTVCTGPCDVPVQVTTSEGGGYLVTGPGEAVFAAATVEAALQYVNEDVLLDAAPSIDRHMPTPTLDLFEGCLVGVAVGDAVGLGVEGATIVDCVDYTEQLKADLGKMLPPWSVPKRPDRNYPPGQISDDTQCTRELARAIVASGGFSVEAFASTLSALHADKGVIGQGPTSRATLDALTAEGGDAATWLTAGTPGAKNLTNGSIMRVAPVGMLGWKEPRGQQLQADAAIQSHVTHHAPLCKAGSAAVGAAVAAALQARALGETDLTAAVLRAMQEPYGSMLSAMLAATDWEAAVDVMYATQPASDEFMETSPFKPPGISMFPPHTAGWAIYSAIAEAEAGFWPSIFTAIAPGGDTDTVAACAGAIAGAWHGLAAIRSERDDSHKVLDLLQDVDEPGSCDVRGLCRLAQGMFHVSVRQRGDWRPEMYVGGSPHSMAPRAVGLTATTPQQLPCKHPVTVVWNNAEAQAIADGCAALEDSGATVVHTTDAASILDAVQSALAAGTVVCVVTTVPDTGEPSTILRTIGNQPDYTVIDELRMLAVPVVVYDHSAMANTMMRHQNCHHWVRHVAYSLHDAVLAASLVTGLTPTLPPTEFGAPARDSGKVCVLGISGSSRGGKGVLSEGLRDTFGAKNCWVIPCDSYFNTMAIGTLGPSWWGGETEPAGDFKETKQGNWDSPGAVDHNKLLADAKQLIAEAERLSAADGEQRLVVFEGFMLFYDPLLVHLFDRQIWLELTYEVAHARRMATTPMPQSHYDNALWPNYCSYKDISVFGTAKVHTIDGTLPPEGVLAEAIAMLGLDAAYPPAAARL